MQARTSVPIPAPVTEVRVILNRHSGMTDKQGSVPALSRLFKAFGMRAHISVANSGSEVFDLAKSAVEGTQSVVVAAGGDGTVSAVAHYLAGTSKTLAILPLGTLNHFAKDLGIPTNLDSAIRSIAAGCTAQVDTGEVNGQIFINNSSLGLYPSLVSEREKRQRLGYRKWPAFVWAAFTVLRRYPFLDVTLSLDGGEFTSRTPFVFIGNNEYQMERFQIGARQCLDAGELSLYITHRTGRLGLLRLAFLALIGRLRKEKDFSALCTREVWIHAKRKRLKVALDGEVQRLKPPLHYRVRPLALRVIVPEPGNE